MNPSITRYTGNASHTSSMKHNTDMENVRNCTRADFSFLDFTRKCVNYTNFKIVTKQCNLSAIFK